MTKQGKKISPAPRLVTALLTRYLRFVARTSRVIAEPENYIRIAEDNQPVVFAFWHGQFLLIPNVRPKSIPTAIMVARHKDADILAAALETFEFQLIRGAGAGTRKRDRGGATALRTSLTALKNGVSISLTADIPPGPMRRAGDGVITLARLSGCSIIPCAVASSRFRTFNTWSRMTLNLPFSRIGVATGEPVQVPRKASLEELEIIRLALECQLNNLTERAYDIAGAKDNPEAPLTGRPTPPGFSTKLYRMVTWVLEPVGPVILNRRARRGKEDPSRQNERLGRPKRLRPDGRLAWFHAASVGELNAIRPLLREIKIRHPELTLLITTGTVTSAKIAADQLGDIAIHQFIPLDGLRMVRRFLDHWRPQAAFFVESEVWPNLIYETADKKIPLILLNATLSDKSAKAWRGLFRTRMAASLFTRFDNILAQMPRDLQRFTRFGVANVEHVGNLKIDARAIPVDPSAIGELKDIIAGRPVLVAASTHPGEDEQIAAAHTIIRRTAPRLLTIIIPRHPDRGPDIAATLATAAPNTARRATGDEISPETDIYIADTIGETGLFFSLADVTFMGGSLVAHGGQNPIEPIRLSSPVLTGPHTHNFESINETLKRHDAIITIASAEELAEQVVTLLSDPAAATQMTERATAALEELEGAMEQTLERITPYLTGSADSAGDQPDAA